MGLRRLGADPTRPGDTRRRGRAERARLLGQKLKLQVAARLEGERCEPTRDEFLRWVAEHERADDAGAGVSKELSVAKPNAISGPTHDAGSPAAITRAGDRTGEKCLEFFTAAIRNENARMADLRAVWGVLPVGGGSRSRA